MQTRASSVLGQGRRRGERRQQAAKSTAGRGSGSPGGMATRRAARRWREQWRAGPDRPAIADRGFFMSFECPERGIGGAISFRPRWGRDWGVPALLSKWLRDADRARKGY